MGIRYFKDNEEVALRAKEIVDNSFRLDKKNAQFVSPARFEKTKNGYRVTTITKIPGQRARSHVVKVDMEDGYQGSFRKANVAIDCDCISGDSIVLTDKGWQTIYSIAGEWEPGDPLTVNYVVNGNTYLGSKPFYKGMQATYKLELQNGHEIKATKDHQVLVSTYDCNKGYKNVWKKVNDVTVGDYLIVTDNVDLLPEKSRSLKFKEAYFVGFWYGDGSFCSKILPDLQIPINHRKQKVISRIVNLGITDDVINIANKKVDRVKFNIKAIQLLQRYGITQDTRHTIPDICLNDPEIMLGFLSGLLDADGTINSSNGMSLHGSKELLKLRDALIRFGIGWVSCKIEEVAGTETNFGKRSKDLYCLSMMPNCFRDLGNRLWLTRKLEYTDNGKQGPIKTKVIHKSFSGRQHVYDIHVPKINRFVCNSVIVHNCGRHLFVWNYALLQYDAASKDRTNGEPPVETNPAETPGCCKHAQVVLRLLMRMNPDWKKTTTKSSSRKIVPLTTLDNMLKRVRKGRV